MNENPDSGTDEFEDPLSDYEPHKYGTEVDRVLAEEPVAEITSTPFLAIRPDATVSQAVKTMSGARSASLLVVEDGRLLGIFTERDVLERVAEQYDKLAASPVRDVMTADPAVVYESDPSAAAVASIAVAGHRHVPVLAVDGTLVGAIGPRRVVEFLDQYLDA